MSPGLTDSQSSEVFRSFRMQGYESNVNIPSWEEGRNRRLEGKSENRKREGDGEMNMKDLPSLRQHTDPAPKL